MSQASPGGSAPAPQPEAPAPQPEAPAPPPAGPAAQADDRSSAGYLAGLQIVASACLAATMFLPWLRWHLGASDYAYSQLRTLWSIVSESVGAPSAWMAIFVVGVAVAGISSIYELVRRPMGYPARTAALAGFALALFGAALGLVVGSSTMGAYDLPDIEDRTTLELGFWLGLGLSAIGLSIAVVSRRMPPNPPRRAGQLVPLLPLAPLSAAPGPASPDYMAHSHYPEHVGSASPSIGPAVYPAPGHLTPAYQRPGRAGQAGLPAAEWETEPASSAARPASGAGRSAGHLVVMEAGRSASMVVQPGQRLLIGRDEDAQIRVSDTGVSFRHATIERRGHEWVVQDVDAVNPTRIVDEWGTSRPVHGETAVASAQLEVGGVRVALYPSRPEG
jgi:hypothetical protein